MPAGDAKAGRTIGRVAQIELEGISINYGNHLCALYETNPGRLKLALPFLLGGLQNSDRCFMVATPRVQSSILKELRQVRSSIDQDIKDGHLVIIDGMSSGDKMYAFFEEAFLNASKHCIQGLRVLGDMA